MRATGIRYTIRGGEVSTRLTGYPARLGSNGVPYTVPVAPYTPATPAWDPYANAGVNPAYKGTQLDQSESAGESGSGYLDADGNFRPGTNPDPTYGGTYTGPASDKVTNAILAPPVGYDAWGKWVGTITNPLTGKLVTAPTGWQILIGAALTGLAVIAISSGGRRR